MSRGLLARYPCARITRADSILRLAVATAALAALFPAGCSNSQTPPSNESHAASGDTATHRADAKLPPLVGVTNGPRVSWSMTGGTLVKVDSRTFRPLPGPRIELGFHGYSWSYSPDRSKLVVGGFASGVRFVDLDRFRHIGDLRENRRGGLVHAVAWPTPRRVLAIVQEPWGSGPLMLATVDPQKRTVLSWRTVSRRATVVRAVANRLGLLLLLGPPRGIGPTKLLFVDVQGTARTVVLSRVRAGQESTPPSPTGRVVRWWRPDLTLDHAGKRAFVVGGGAPVAEVDLRSMSVTYHELREPISFLDRFRDWLAPAAHAKGETEGPTRYAHWLSHGVLAVSGFDARGMTPSKARGLKLIDTRTWMTRTLDRSAGDFDSTPRLLLTYSCCFGSSESRGLTAYDTAGRVRWRLFGRTPIHAVQVRGGRAYVQLPGTWSARGVLVAIVDLSRGKVLRTVRSPWTQLLLPGQTSMAEKEA